MSDIITAEERRDPVSGDARVALKRVQHARELIGRAGNDAFLDQCPFACSPSLSFSSAIIYDCPNRCAINLHYRQTTARINRTSSVVAEESSHPSRDKIFRIADRHFTQLIRKREMR